MNTEEISKTKVGQSIIHLMAAIMESPLRYTFFSPSHVLEGVEDFRGQYVLEVGCGTGYFTLSIARLLGNEGLLISMDMLTQSVETVRQKVQEAKLQNAQVVQGDALDTKLEPVSLDCVLIFGVLPAPMLPLDKLLCEVHRILKPGGRLSIWPTTLINHAVLQSGLFKLSRKKNGVSSFIKV